MKILFLISGMNEDGGIQVFNRYLIRALVESGHSLNVISINDRNAISVQGYAFFPCGGYGIFRKAAFIVYACIRAVKSRPDIIICGHINFSFSCLLLKACYKIPYISVAHGIEAWKMSFLSRIGVLYSTRIFAVSRFTRDRVARQLPEYPAQAIRVLFNTFDADKFTPRPKPLALARELGIKSEDKVILTVARLSKRERYKGYDSVILSLKEILSEVPDLKYVVVGSGSDLQRIRRLIRENNLEGQVILSGPVSHERITDYYNLCDLFIMPSTQEGFGIVFLEALACGKPVIAGNLDASSEALLAGELGLLVNPHDRNEIKKAIIMALERELPDRFFDAALLRQKVIDNFGFDIFKETVNKLFSLEALEPVRRVGAGFIIKPVKGWVAMNVKEMWYYRELLYFMVWRDIKVRYKQTVVGAAWAVLQPILMMVVFSLFFGKFMKVPRVGIPYPLFSYAAILPWTLFNEGVTRSANSLTQGSGMVTKVYFPRIILPIAGVVSPLVEFFFAFLVFIGLMLYYGFTPGLKIILLPVFLLLTLTTSLAVGLWLSALNVQYRDVRYIVPFLMQFWFFASPVVYSSTTMSESWQFLYSLNPMVGIIESFRWILLGTEPPGQLMYSSLGAAVLIMILGAFYFRKKERILVDFV